MKKTPKWVCQDCHASATHLRYCSICFKVICNRCYDPFVGACEHCAKELFKGSVTKFEATVKNTGNGATVSQLNLEVPLDKCKECGKPLIITPDRTRCCSRCGLVVGPGYSWLGGTSTSGWSGVIDNIERIFEERVSKQGWG